MNFPLPRPLQMFAFVVLLCAMGCLDEKDPPVEASANTVVVPEAWEGTVDEGHWFTVHVPGHAALDLMGAGLLDDPYKGTTNEADAEWMEHTDFTYRSVFYIEETSDDTSDADAPWFLDAEGLDTFVEVFVNGELVLVADNAHRRWVAEVSSVVKEGWNYLELHFAPTVERGLALRNQHDLAVPASNEPRPHNLRTSPFVRRPAYTFGWDWGPRIVSPGVTRPIALRKGPFIEEVTWELEELESDRATYTFRVFTRGLGEAGGGGPAHVLVEVDGKGFELEWAERRGQGAEWRGEVVIERPDLWWPNGMGEQPLYDVLTELRSGATSDVWTGELGVRELLLDTMGGPDGRFQFVVNGEVVFARGANVIPTDFFTARAAGKGMLRAVGDAEDANMNMLRVWGGGQYMDELFYRACDRAGILVWQDFMSACMMVPTDESFRQNFESEAREHVRRLSRHASLAVWCGNNESFTAWNKWGWQDEFDVHGNDSTTLWIAYDRLFQQDLPQIVEAESDRPYWPSSPSAGMNELENPLAGDQHAWRVWFDTLAFDWYGQYGGTFVSEFGLQSLPRRSTIEAMTEGGSEGADGLCDVLRSRQRSRMPWIEPDFDGWDMMALHCSRHLGKSIDFEGLTVKGLDRAIYLTQRMQADGLWEATTAHRIAPGTAGSLYWQLDDVWPTVSWSTVDYFGHWKPAHHAVQRAFAPALLAIRQPGDDVNGTASVHLCEEREAGIGQEAAGKTIEREKKLEITWQTPAGDTLRSWSGVGQYQGNACDTIWSGKIVSGSIMTVQYGELKAVRAVGTPAKIDWLEASVELVSCGNGCWTVEPEHWVYGLWAEVKSEREANRSGRFGGNGAMAGPGWPVEFRWEGEGKPPSIRDIGLNHLAEH